MWVNKGAVCWHAVSRAAFDSAGATCRQAVAAQWSVGGRLRAVLGGTWLQDVCAQTKPRAVRRLFAAEDAVTSQCFCLWWSHARITNHWIILFPPGCIFHSPHTGAARTPIPIPKVLGPGCRDLVSTDSGCPSISFEVQLRGKAVLKWGDKGVVEWIIQSTYCSCSLILFKLLNLHFALFR